MRTIHRYEELLGRTIVFRDKIGCHQCGESDPYELCPNIGHPKECPQTRYVITVEKISCTRENGKVRYTVNDRHGFTGEDFRKRVRVGRIQGK